MTTFDKANIGLHFETWGRYNKMEFDMKIRLD